MSGIDHARAIAVFNPTAPRPGFLQPLFAGPAGDNKSYVQILADPARIQAFLPVAWPERDCMMLALESVALVGGESLWGFAFDGEAPLVLPWSTFREAMAERVQEALVNNPLLQFDIVDTLDLVTLKRPVYTTAFERYRRIGRETAERWRDRAILEPALAKALGTIDVIGTEPTAMSDRPYFRARISRGEVVVALERLEGMVEARLNDAYRELQQDLPEIFPANAEVTVRRRAQPKRRRAKSPGITIVLVGRIRQGEVERDRWAALDSEVVYADHFHPEFRIGRDARLTIILGAQSDWQLMVEAGRRMRDRPAVMVTLSTSVALLVRDLKFQEEAPHPTIAFFAPFATNTAVRRDPIQSIASLVEILRAEIADGRTSLPLVAQHCMLIRESIRADQTPVQVSCRIGARALRAGAVLEGSARLYCQGRINEPDQNEWEHLLRPLFRVEPHTGRERLEGRRAVLLLLVERNARFEPGQMSEQLYEGARRLLEIRGWRVIDGDGRHLSIADPQRQFAVTIVDQNEPAPNEDTFGATPGLGRAPVLVIHAQPKREQLLVGNRGQFFHIALEDIALMTPESPWIWPILRRQLLETSSGSLTLAALRLAAALVAEAIRMNRVQTSLVDVDWDKVADVMSADDCERFVEFHGRGILRRRALLVTKVANNQTPPVHGPAVVELTIEDDGPVVSAAVDLLRR